MPKLNIVTEWNKFRQLVGHKLTDLRLSMQRFCRTCDQIVEKTSNVWIRVRLLLEDMLTLDKTLKISAQIGNAAAEAKTIPYAGGGVEAVVGMVRGTAFRVGRQKQQKYSSSHSRPPQAAAVLYAGLKVAGKTCYRCGSSHFANHPKCPAKSVADCEINMDI